MVEHRCSVILFRYHFHGMDTNSAALSLGGLIISTFHFDKSVKAVCRNYVEIRVVFHLDREAMVFPHALAKSCTPCKSVLYEISENTAHIRL